MPQFNATIKHIRDGVRSFTIAAATRNIESWEAILQTLDTPGAKTILRDLESLKKHLHARSLDGGAIQTLIARLGRETVTLAGKAEGKTAEKAKKLGEALTAAAAEAGPAKP